eukprot:CAMPEP_0171110930 /NCGR_PEP_ID=MMETSP0766_2-20121228/73072_1 /TAXON_ID=439317 /ORGANISM="Gambierdiscus australes, Strain CAWD 149" /LENGTH=55 /DNA_ID=CAMNT_0011572857 /DNA_START=1 /DNA_END=165 /DNA_ORIENTATION=-
MMLSMVVSLRSLVWSLALLVMVMFGFAVSLITSFAEGVADGSVAQGACGGMLGSL